MTASFLAAILASGYPIYTDDSRGVLKATRSHSNIAILNTSSATINTAATVNTNITNGSFSFTKLYDAATTDIVIIAALSARVDTTNRGLTVAVGDGTTDRDLTKMFYNTASEHLSFIGGVKITTLEAKVYTFQFKMRNSGTGIMVMDTADTLSAIAWEVCK